MRLIWRHRNVMVASGAAVVGWCRLAASSGSLECHGRPLSELNYDCLLLLILLVRRFQLGCCV